MTAWLIDRAMAADVEMKRAQLLSTVGAALLGAGLALFAASWLSDWKYVLAIVGLLMHSLGMYGKRAWEKRAGMPRPLWEEIAYWGCWVVLAALAAWVMATRLGYS